MYEIEFLKQQGNKTWLQGLDYIPAKLRALSTINKILAHQPWLLSPSHIEVRNKFCSMCKKYIIRVGFLCTSKYIYNNEVQYKSKCLWTSLKGALSRGFRRFLVLTVLKSTLPMKNIIFKHLKEDIT